MNLVELELDETLADFEVQDWIDNVFSVQYPDVKARIKKGCSGLCHKKDEWHYVKDGEYPSKHLESYVVAFYGAKGSFAKGKPCWEELRWDAEFSRWVDRETFEDLPYVNTEGIVIAWKEIVLPKEK